MTGRPRPIRRVITGVAVALQVTSGCLLAAVSASPAAASAPVPPSLRTPLPTAVTTPGGSWAVVAMGQPGVPLNTFWELFFRGPGASSWKLVTPPGVADNGGLTVSAVPTGAITVGFEPSQLLRYSPLALSSDAGAKWTPALVPASLVAAPDALAASSGGGPAVALLRHGAGQVVMASSGALLSWRPLSGNRSLTNGASLGCDIDGLDAVALGLPASPLVGTGCRHGGQVGIFSHVGSRWQLIGPSLSGALAGATTRVLRLDATATTATALVAARRGGRTSLLSLWRAATGTWAFSGPLRLGSTQKVVASAVGESGEQVVLLSKQGTDGRLEVAKGPGLPWSSLPSPPAGTMTVALLADGSANAFSVNGARLRVFQMIPGQAGWTLSQSTSVPIAYGSS